MGQKKRTTATSTATTTATTTTAATTTTSTTTPPPDPAAIKQECERALAVLRRGNHHKALRLMKETTLKHPSSPLLHRVHASISLKSSVILDDPSAKLRHLNSALTSAAKATSLSPNSLEFSLFYATLLFDTASDAKSFESVVTECERALSLSLPSDPAVDNPLYEKPAESTADSRIANLHHELRSLIQKANLGSISTWMKNLGGAPPPPVDDRFRMIPLRRMSEDPIEARFFQMSGGGNGSGGSGGVRRANEIKKANKTPEERRKEIEVRVAAARLLQQKSEIGDRGGADEREVSGSRAAQASGSKGSDRRRVSGSRRNASISERKDQVKSFWNSMDGEMKRGLLRVHVSNLRAYFSNSSKDAGQACEVLLEALAFGEMNKTWKFWACCHCGERFSCSESHMQHVVQEHMGNLLPKIQSAVPPNVDKEWAEMLVNCSWMPLDLTASVRILEERSKPKDSRFSGTENNMERISNCWSDSFCSDETWESFPEKKNFTDNCNGDVRKLSVECKTCDGNEVSHAYNLPSSWPLSEDAERSKLLEKISFLFEILVRHKYLAMSHLRKVMQFTMEELQGIVPGSEILSCGVDQTPLCICFLGAASLKKIIKFLQEVSYSCGLGRYPEKVTPEETGSRQVSDCEDRVMLSEDASTLQLDENLFPCVGLANDVVLGNPVVVIDKDAQSGADSFLSWIYAGPPSGEQLATWSRIREEKGQQGMEVLLLLEKEFGQLQHICEKKYEHLAYEEALQGLEELFLEENKKREHGIGSEHPYRSYDSILRKRRDELVEGENEVMFVSSRLELDAISNVLKEAENINVNQFGYEDNYGGVTSHLCDLEAGEDDWRSKDYLHQMDTCVDIALQRQKEHVLIELSKLDARILRSVNTMQQLELKLEPLSAFDYRTILVPLVKSFMRSHLEDLAEKDATEKSDAAREAFLAELALDSQKGFGNGNDNSKSSQEKVKDKRKSKDSRRNKDSKVASCNEQLDSTEQFFSATASDGDHVDTDMVALESGVNVNKLEEEFQRKVELEAEERKLEETLEYQRRIENEAKQKLLAEQRKRNALATSWDVVEATADVSLNPGFSAALLKKNEPLALKNVFVDCLDDFQRNLSRDSDVSIIADDCTRGVHSCQNGLIDAGSSNDEVFTLERRAGRRGKRRNSLKVTDQRSQALSYGKENVAISIPDAMQKNQVQNQNGVLSNGIGDGGSKTLRQLQAEEDEEERFQADLKKAVRQSLDTFQAHQKLPLSNSRVDVDISGSKAGEVIVENRIQIDVVGTGLQNEVGEYNCFLNVIIQSLWHLRRFREEFLRRSTSEHVHIGDPCVVCALFDILSNLSLASGDMKREPVAPTSLRIALSNLYPESNFFQEGQMNDASEVLAVIFECLHLAFASGSSVSESDSAESNCLGSWDCSNPFCIAHSLFGMDISERMNCYHCGLESRHLKYTSFFHNINASALRTMKVMCAENSFDELLNLVEMNHQLACDPEAGGCGKLNHIHHILSNPPHVFTTVLGWQNTCESVDDIKATLAALATELDISILYRGLDPKNVHGLVSVVCYYGQHYHCFAYSCDHEKWIMYDDKTVKVIGTWEDVLSMCERGHLQPQVLFYEAVN